MTVLMPPSTYGANKTVHQLTQTDGKAATFRAQKKWFRPGKWEIIIAQPPTARPDGNQKT